MHNVKDDGPMSQGTLDVLAERRRQLTEEGFTPNNDLSYRCGELQQAAACYALNAVVMRGYVPPVTVLEQVQRQFGQLWPFSARWWKPKSPRRDMVRAAALLLAAIDAGDLKNKGTEW